jgi:peptidyl-dipeptidase Dcp
LGYVEFPSQILERWLETQSKFALHYKTNEPIPMALVERIDKHLLLMRDSQR